MFKKIVFLTVFIIEIISFLLAGHAFLNNEYPLSIYYMLMAIYFLFSGRMMDE